jgi:ABC-2 type transport system permease protein
MADRIGVISKGEHAGGGQGRADAQAGRKQLTLQLQQPLQQVPAALAYAAGCWPGGLELTYTYDTQGRAHRHRRAADRPGRRRHRLQGPAHHAELAGGHLRRPGEEEPAHPGTMNLHAVKAIYGFEMARTWRTLMQSIVSPVISPRCTSWSSARPSARASRRSAGVSYGAFIVPGLIMLSLLTQSISNASFGIYFPRFTGTIYELLSAPISYVEIVIAYVGAAATKSIMLGLIILATAALFVPLRIEHPLWMLAFLVLTAVTFSLIGFIIGIWADGFEKLQMVPMLIVTPLTFLGGSFYSIDMLPPFWQTVAYLFNPVVYLVSGFRWSFYGVADVARWLHQPGP